MTAYRPRAFEMLNHANLERSKEGIDDDMNFEYTTAIPHTKTLAKRDREGEFIRSTVYTTWVHIDATVDPALQKYIDYLYHHEVEAGEDLDKLTIFPEEETDIKASIDVNCSRVCMGMCKPDTSNCIRNGRKCTSMCENCVADVQYRPQDCGNLRPRRLDLRGSTDDCQWLPINSINEIDRNKFIWGRPPLRFLKRYKETQGECEDANEVYTFFDFEVGENMETYRLPDEDNNLAYGLQRSLEYRLLAGNQEDAALFTINPYSHPIKTLDIEELTTILKTSSISGGKLCAYPSSLPEERIHDNSTGRSRVPAKQLFKSLDALVAASKLYEDWPEATISMEITKRIIGQSRWAATLGHAFNERMSYRACKFACIAMFESGVHDFYPGQLQNVIAMASGNSIYVVEALLQDPSIFDRSNLPEFTGIRRILGTLERPVIVMLVPPQVPRVRNSDLKNWRVVHQTEFDGISKDYFEQTSLHLTFTESEISLAIEPGAVDAEVIILEALISVHDCRTWVADLDILGGLANDSLRYMLPCSSDLCSKTPERGTFGPLLANTLGPQLRSMTNWEEFLCHRENLMSTEIGVLRTSKNWLARLAAAALSGQMVYSTGIIPSDLCSNCNDRLIARKLWVTPSGKTVELLVA